MAERIRSAIALVVIILSLGVVSIVLALDDGGDTNRVEALATRLKCPVCTSESVADSPAQVSRDLYALIEEQVATGASDSEIEAFFVATYGAEVLLDPPTGGSTAVLWIAPLIALAVGGVAIANRVSNADRSPTADEQQAVARALDELQ
jgi:cytochrome c-type biogenesis protein CcmH